MSDIHVCVCACWYVCVWTMWEACKGFALFERESLRYPGFVEFDDVNGKVLTYSVAGMCISWCIRDSTDFSYLNECISSFFSLLFLSWAWVLCTHASPQLCRQSVQSMGPEELHSSIFHCRQQHLWDQDQSGYTPAFVYVQYMHMYDMYMYYTHYICFHILQSASLCFIANEHVLALSFTKVTSVFYLLFVVAMR